MQSEQPDQPVQYAVLIPAYQPSPGLIKLVSDLSARTMPAILLVDDGSGPEFREIFDRAAAFPGVQILRHAVNLGKGAALKTGLNHALCAFPNLVGIVTADADGQHHPEDIANVAASLLDHPGALILGARTFDADVPLRSRFGNILTSKLMHALIGARLRDTQTGLRGIPAAFAARLLSVEARGYEFELEMLIAARHSGMPLVEVPIRTIYEPGNKSSHFNPLTDSMKIYFVLLRFSSVSLMAALLDNLIFYLIWKRTGYILGAQVVARVASVVFNYSMVRARVFASKEGHQVLLPKYLLLVVASGTASYLGIQFFTTRLHVSAMSTKLVVETLLFIVNFAVQRMFIFRGHDAAGESGTASSGRPTAARFYAWLIFAVFALLVALEVYGFRTAPLFSQEIWQPEGRARLIQFAAFYIAAATVFLILVPWLFAPLAAVLLVALTTFCLGPQTAFAVAFFLLSAWSLGNLIGRRVPHLLAILLGMSIYIFFMPFAARLPVNYWWSYALVLALPILANFRDLPRNLPAAPELRSWPERLGAALLLFVLITHWFAMLKPEASADGLSMHLAVPANIAAHHLMTFDPGRIVWAVMPMGADFTYTIVYLLGGEMAARLLNFIVLLILLGMLYNAVRRSVSGGVALFLVALFATTPMVQLVTGSLFVENLLTAFLLGMMSAIWLFAESADRRYLYIAAIVGGAAMATKFGAVAFIAPALLCAGVEVWRHRKQSGARWGLALALLLAAAAPPYAIAWRQTGNPLFPFRNDKFHSRQLDPKADIRDDRFHKPLTWNTPYDLTFRSNRHYEGQDGSFGFQYLVMTPLALLALLVAPRRQAVGAAVVSLTAILLVLSSEPNARYLYPALPLLSVPLAALLGWAAINQRMLARALLVFLIACATVNIYFLPASSYYHKDFYGPFTNADREAYLGVTAPIRVVIGWFNHAHPHVAVLLAQDSYLAGIDGEVYENHWHQYNTLDQLRHAANIEDVRHLLDRWKVRYLIARKPTISQYARPLALRQLLDQCSIAEFAFGEFYAARVEPVCRAAAKEQLAPLITAQPGTYDDLDPAILLSGDWERNEQFEETYRHSISFTDTPGAEVRFAFLGSELTWVFTKAPNRGIAAISIDGIPKGTVDLYSAKAQWQSRLLFDHLAPGRHMLVIRVTGKSAPAAQGKFVDVDALQVK